MKTSGLNFRKFLVTNGNFQLNDMRSDNSTICRFVWNPSEEISALFVPVSKFLAEWKVSNEFVFPTFFAGLTICLVCNRIFNFRRGKGSKKSHISVSDVEQSHAKFQYYLSPFQNFWLNGSVQRVWFSNFLCLTI